MELNSETNEDRKEWKLEPGTEYRFELDVNSSVLIRLVSGLAEIFGYELSVGRAYFFGSECKAAIFTWQGCTIEICRPSTEYVSEETAMMAYANLHLVFEQMRIKARRAQKESRDAANIEKQYPRILILGPENSGKTTACKILANYAARTGQRWTPMLVNLDPNEGAWTIPGTISASPLNMPIPTSSPAYPLGSSATSAPTAITSFALLPIVYWFGHVEMRRNLKLMEKHLHLLAEKVNARFRNDPLGCQVFSILILVINFFKTPGACGGLIIDTPAGYSTPSTKSGERYPFIRACVDHFKVNVIIVIGHEKLNVEMRREFGNSLTVVKVPKSGGVVDLDFAYRARMNTLQLHTYLYGQSLTLPPGVTSSILGGEAVEGLSLSPHSFVLELGDLKIYRIGEATMAPSSALPIGASRVISEMQPVLVDPTQSGSGLLNSVLALLPQKDEKQLDDTAILESDVVGFLIMYALLSIVSEDPLVDYTHSTAIDIKAKQMTVLSPAPGTLQGRIAIMGTLEWQE